MDTQMEVEHYIWVAAQENVLEQEQELDACCRNDCGDGDDGRDDHDDAWVQDLVHQNHLHYVRNA
jgi:hypothetical protein